MARIVLFVAIAVAVWWLVRRIGGTPTRPAAPEPIDRHAPGGIEATVQCAWCGVHVPRGEAVALADGRVYCSVAHRDAARAAPAPVDRDGA